ncbi:uncharacterized protein EV420DRAFT_1650129 [Desarmillaria tabescens]|uniref:Uncharacterized protein n=1 Tax=Armillaria tabescens TaxID=1929756 RepID=A0AA39JIR4_ARMTA|nr:uncharacterized protein EV420DRAFT_1650129 [Desarmillaria tabescens]KAK0441208.1 hypothetical protein EV420DRAFT_1650129 [Desarmillaria tabescens]
MDPDEPHISSSLFALVYCYFEDLVVFPLLITLDVIFSSFSIFSSLKMSFSYAPANATASPRGMRSAGRSSSTDANGTRVSTEYFRSTSPPSTPKRKARGRLSGPGPERSPHRWRSRAQSPTDNYAISRSNSSHRARPSTPPPSITAEAFSPLSPPSKYNKHATTMYQGPRIQRYKSQSRMESLLPASLSEVPRRGSTPGLALYKMFDFAPNGPDIAQVCSTIPPCAWIKTSASSREYQFAFKLPQPGDDIRYLSAAPRQCWTKITFADKHRAINPNDPSTTVPLAGVSLVEVLLSESGRNELALVDGEQCVSFGNRGVPTTIDLSIRINGYPPTIPKISVSCAHGQLTRRGLLSAIAKEFYLATKSGKPTRGFVHHSGLPERISLDNLRIVSIYAIDDIVWHPELLYCSSVKK